MEALIAVHEKRFKEEVVGGPEGGRSLHGFGVSVLGFLPFYTTVIFSSV